MKDTYKVKCHMDHGGLYLSITHNGSQWTSTHIADPEHEIPLIIAALKKEFKSDAKPCTHPRGYIKSIRICGLCGEQI